jgi:aspartyl-tRNA(Asn)/glutamyl-tRNA(Gln) amidotransferase subunit B
MNQYQLADYDASIISAEKEIADYFFETAEYCKSYKSIVNWLMGVIKSHLNENSMSIQDFVIRPQVLAEIISLIDKDVINQTVASQQLFRHLITHPDDDPQQVVVNLNLVQDANADSIQSLIDEVLQTQPEKVKAYHNGKKGLTGLFMGQLMKKMSTGIDPKKANQLILETLNKLK